MVHLKGSQRAERGTRVPAPESAPMQRESTPKPPCKPHGSLSAAASSARLIRLPVCVQGHCGQGDSMQAPCSGEAGGKLLNLPQYDGVCGGSCQPLTPGVAALVDSGATNSFVGQKLVDEYQLPVTKDDGM